jgi:hypothetical protein
MTIGELHRTWVNASALSKVVIHLNSELLDSAYDTKMGRPKKKAHRFHWQPQLRKRRGHQNSKPDFQIIG